MSHPRTPIPNSWDDDEWDTPPARGNYKQPSIASPPIVLASSSSASAFPAAPVIITSSQQPRTLYKPELTILKRASPTPASTQPPITASSRSEEKDRKERERKARERHYQQVKDRIFAGDSPSSTSPPSKSNNNNNNNNNNKKKPNRSGSNTPKKTTPPPPPVVASPRPPLGSGAITGFSLNSGSLSAAPVRARERQEWQLRQVALDGKMLESQAEAYGYGRDEELLGDKERGLDWDEFRRDQWGGDRDYVENEGEDLGGRLEKLDLVEFGESAEEKGSRRGGALLPVREPKGPDAAGRGFGGRGRGGRGGFGGH